MTIDLMHGPHFAKSYVTNYLRADLPVRLVSYRNGWNLDDITLPTPVQFINYEPIGLDEWPSIITVAMSMTGLERFGFDRNHPEYRVIYSMRTYVWVKTEFPELATLMRDRLTAVVRSALLDYPCLKATDPRQTFQAKIDEGTIREEYSDLTLLKGDRVLAGSYLSYDLAINEIVMREPLGVVSDVNINVVGYGIETTDLDP